VTLDNFVSKIHEQAHAAYRDMPWRVSDKGGTFDGYKVLVSEFMLQQTQVSRVIPKYQYFLDKFPTITSLANASLADVLLAWSGLGYNRRAKYLHEAAKILQHVPQPWQYDDLVKCIGIGPNTANALRVYAYNLPEVFIETNIRTVYIHYFFTNSIKVDDKQILALVDKTMDRKSPRSWYWALMDIGARLKNNNKNGLAKSATYKKQPTFNGSLRQIRGLVLKSLVDGPCSADKLSVVVNDSRLDSVLLVLQSEGLISRDSKSYYLGG